MKEIIITSEMIETSMLAALIDIKIKKALENSFNDMEKFSWKITFKVKKR